MMDPERCRESEEYREGYQEGLQDGELLGFLKGIHTAAQKIKQVIQE